MATNVEIVSGDDQGAGIYVAGKLVFQCSGTNYPDADDALWALHKAGIIEFDARQVEYEELEECLEANKGKYPKSITDVPCES